MATVNSATQAAENVYAGLGRSSPVKEKEETQQMRFLTLLTTQLKNQDPMNPLENAELTSQLAQMSTVEGIEKLNKQVEQILGSRDSDQWLQASALVGRGVLVEGKSLMLTEQGGVGGFELQSAASQVKVSITDANGIKVAELDLGEAKAGSHNFVWDGVTSSGQKAAPGAYTISVSALDGDKQVAATALQFGAVSGVIRGAKGSDLQVGDLGIFKLNDIKQIL